MEVLKKISKVLDYAIPVITAIIGGFLIGSIWNCYFHVDGNLSGGVFSTSNVSKYFSWSIAPLIILLVLIIFGGVLKIILHEEDKRQGVENTYLRFKKAYCKTHLNKLDTPQEKNYLQLINIFLIVSSIVILICAIFMILYFVNNKIDSNGDVTKQTISVLAHLLPFILLIFIALNIDGFFISSFMKDYIRLTAKVSASENKITISNKAIWIIRGIVFALALTFIIVGIVNKGYLGVLDKAAKICQECIGIG